MTPQTFKLFQDWCERHCKAPMNELVPMPIDGWAVVRALWPLNDAFRPNFAAFKGMPYGAEHEPQADAAIERYLATGSWGPVSIETWRVLLERQQQAIMVAVINAQQGNPPMRAPDRLPEAALTGAAMLWFLHSMRLPFPPDDRSRSELPSDGPPVA
jgi:hypothetical protein